MRIDDNQKRWRRYLDNVIASLSDRDREAVSNLSDEQLILIVACYASKISGIQQEMKTLPMGSTIPHDKSILLPSFRDKNTLLKRVVMNHICKIEDIIKSVKKAEREKSLKELARKGDDSIKKTHLTLV